MTLNNKGNPAHTKLKGLSGGNEGRVNRGSGIATVGAGVGNKGGSHCSGVNSMQQKIERWGGEMSYVGVFSLHVSKNYGSGTALKSAQLRFRSVPSSWKEKRIKIIQNDLTRGVIWGYFAILTCKLIPGRQAV